jgi:hypothetical protein
MTRVFAKTSKRTALIAANSICATPKWRLTIDSKAGEAPPDIGCLFQSMMNLPLSPGLNRPTPLSRIRHGDFSIMPTCAVISRPKSDASLLEHLNGHSERLCAGRPGLLNPLSE